MRGLSLGEVGEVETATAKIRCVTVKVASFFYFFDLEGVISLDRLAVALLRLSRWDKGTLLLEERI
jgi:hypothetical protein